MENINFTLTKEDADLIGHILNRAMKEERLKKHTDHLSLFMDLTATHLNGCRLDLQRLLEAPDFDFFHDICGIISNLNRETGKIENCFSPRYSSQENALSAAS